MAYKYSSYKYITNKDFSTEFNSNEEEIRVNLCVYNINTDCFIETTTVKDMNESLHEKIKKRDFKLNALLKHNGVQTKQSFICPFLEFVFTNNNSQYEFPSFIFKPMQVTGKTVPKRNEKIIEDDIDYSYGNKTYFENECFLQLFKLFKTIPHETHLSNSINNMYKGFIKSDEPHYTVFFNITPFIIINPNLLKIDYLFGILDEIIYKKKIWDTPIDKEVTKLFKKYKKLRVIINEDDEEYPIPIQTYMCEKINQQYLSKSSALFPSCIEPFGLCYYMTNSQLSSNPDRYAVFVVNCLYNIELMDSSDIFIANKKGELKELTGEELSNALLSNSSFYFNDIDIQIWGIRDNLHLTKLK